MIVYARTAEQVNPQKGALLQVCVVGLRALRLLDHSGGGGDDGGGRHLPLFVLQSAPCPDTPTTPIHAHTFALQCVYSIHYGSGAIYRYLGVETMAE